MKRPSTTAALLVLIVSAGCLAGVPLIGNAPDYFRETRPAESRTLSPEPQSRLPDPEPPIPGRTGNCPAADLDCSSERTGLSGFTGNS